MDTDRLYLVSGVPKRFVESTPDSIDPKVRADINTYLKKYYPSHGLYLHGKTGRGKTSAAACVFKTLLENNVFGYWLQCSEMLNSWINRPVTAYHVDIWEAVTSWDLLVLDDLTLGSTAHNKALEALLRARSSKRLCTIITSNLTPPYLRANAEVLHSLLHEFCIQVLVEGEDQRFGKSN